MIAHYPHFLKNQFFYHKTALCLLNVSIVNSWIQQNLKMGGQAKKRDRPTSSSICEQPPKQFKSCTKVDPVN